MKTLQQIREASGGKEAYQKFFNSILKKFGVSSPAELEGDKKKEFYNAIDKGWDGDNEKPEANEKMNQDNMDWCALQVIKVPECGNKQHQIKMLQEMVFTVECKILNGLLSLKELVVMLLKFVQITMGTVMATGTCHLMMN